MTGLRPVPFDRLLLLFVLALAACSTSTAPDETGPVEETPCTDVTLGRDRGMPLDVVALDNLPPSADETSYMEVSVEGSNDTGVAPIIWRGDQPRMLTPLHPVDFIAGGAVQLTIVSGAERCGPIAFTVDPLPEAPGAFVAALEELRGLIGEWAGAHGTDPDQWLAADPTSLEPHEIGYLLAHDLISNPDNPNAVSYLLDGTAPVLGGDVASVDFLDRLTARIGIGPWIAAVRGEVDALPPFSARVPRAAGAACVEIPDAPSPDLYMTIAALGARSASSSRDRGRCRPVSPSPPPPRWRTRSLGCSTRTCSSSIPACGRWT